MGDGKGEGHLTKTAVDELLSPISLQVNWQLAFRLRYALPVLGYPIERMEGLRDAPLLPEGQLLWLREHKALGTNEPPEMRYMTSVQGTIYSIPVQAIRPKALVKPGFWKILRLRIFRR